jgi:dienelactone hydrolase
MTVQALLQYYDYYANLLASWGYAVLQYDLQCLISNDLPFCVYLERNKTSEVHALPEVLRWARAGLPQVGVAARIQWDTIAVAGHSVGGGVAFEQQFAFDSIKTVALLDPVLFGSATASVTKPAILVGAVPIDHVIWRDDAAPRHWYVR